MDDQTGAFGDVAQRLARNPLGIIALFIVFLYGFASLVVAFGGSLGALDRHVLVWFLVGFPVLVLGMFGWLVSRHSARLFAPSDFREEENFLKALTASASLGAAAAKADRAPSASDLREVAESVSRAPSEPYRRRQVLWVDDRPDNNVYERRAFEALGIEVTLARSTAEALAEVARQRFAAIISDMGRAEGDREGYVLLDALRAGGNRTPFFLYSLDADTPEHQREARRHGADGSTSRPQELLTAVLRAVLAH